jgi:hypothetical protein
VKKSRERHCPLRRLTSRNTHPTQKLGTGETPQEKELAEVPKKKIQPEEKKKE